jgi:hypothetical protein
MSSLKRQGALTGRLGGGWLRPLPSEAKSGGATLRQPPQRVWPSPRRLHVQFDVTNATALEHEPERGAVY